MSKVSADNTPMTDSRFDQIVEMVMKIASGDLEARVTPSDRGDELDSLIVGLNMLGEELASTIETERNLRETLETRVRHRTAELEEKLRIIEKQRQAILELSTPVIAMWDEIVVLPLIGTVDTQRAQQILDNLLESIARTKARVAIIDITGVPVVDTKVAHHFLRTIEAARILGTETILTGVSPYNAQALVKLGVDLSRITTKSSLRAGLALAFALTRKKVVNDTE